MARLVDEARRHGAHGVTGVHHGAVHAGRLHRVLVAGHRHSGQRRPAEFFTTSASGSELYCHLDAGYRPLSFVMGNVAYALGIGRGITGGLSTLAQGEVRQYSEMYNGIRHLALFRLRREAANVGAKRGRGCAHRFATVRAGCRRALDDGHRLAPPGAGASDRQPRSNPGRDQRASRAPRFFSLAHMGYAPVQLVMATSVYSLGLVGGIGASFSALAKGELREVTELVYGARENCLSLLRREAEALGAERVVGNRLQIRELSPGLLEVVAVGTAVRRWQGITPHSVSLPVQAVVRDDESLSMRGGGSAGFATSLAFGAGVERGLQRRASPGGCLAAIVIAVLMLVGILVAVLSSLAR